jgi:hypothetical protein
MQAHAIHLEVWTCFRNSVDKSHKTPCLTERNITKNTISLSKTIEHENMSQSFNTVMLHAEPVRATLGLGTLRTMIETLKNAVSLEGMKSGSSKIRGLRGNYRFHFKGEKHRLGTNNVSLK